MAYYSHSNFGKNVAQQWGSKYEEEFLLSCLELKAQNVPVQLKSFYLVVWVLLSKKSDRVNAFAERHPLKFWKDLASIQQHVRNYSAALVSDKFWDVMLAKASLWMWTENTCPSSWHKAACSLTFLCNLF